MSPGVGVSQGTAGRMGTGTVLASSGPHVSTGPFCDPGQIAEGLGGLWI